MPKSSIEFHEAAAADYDAAFDWYLQRSPDAANEFAAEVDRALVQIRRAPGRWAIGESKTRRFLLRRFPFLVIYREFPADTIQVLAIAHTSRRPGYWKTRS